MNNKIYNEYTQVYEQSMYTRRNRRRAGRGVVAYECGSEINKNNTCMYIHIPQHRRSRTFRARRQRSRAGSVAARGCAAEVDKYIENECVYIYPHTGHAQFRLRSPQVTTCR